MRILCSLLLTAFFILNSISGNCQEVPFQDFSPEIDGDFIEPCWENLPWQSGFTALRTMEKTAVQTRFKMFHNGHVLFLAAEMDEPDTAKLVRSQHIYNSPNIWSNDSLEIFIVTDPNMHSFYQIIVDSSGNRYNVRNVDNNAGRYNADPFWDSNLEVKTAVENNKWRIEAALPLGTLDFNGDKWRINLARNRHAVKPAENSSFAPNSSSAHANLNAFKEFKLENFSVKAFPFQVEPASGTFNRTGGGKYEYRLTAHISSRADQFRVVRLRAFLRNAEGKIVVENTRAAEAPAGKFSEHKIVWENVRPGNYTLGLEVMSNSSKLVLLAQHLSAAALEYAPVSIKFNKPAYRDNIYATMPDKEIEAVITLKDFTGLPLTVKLTDGAAFNELRKIDKGEAVNILKFNGADLPDGRYFLEVTGGDPANPVTVRKQLRKLPYQKGEIWLDGNGIAHIDGKHFMPFGWYGHDDPADGKVWINSVLNTTLFGGFEQLCDFVAKTQKRGRYTMLYPFQEFNPKFSWQVFSKANRKAGLTPEQRQGIIDFFTQLQGREGLIGWYMADEPENHGDNPRWYMEAYELIRELDPYRPCFMLNWGIGGIRRYYESCDILLPDCYPCYFEDGSTSKPRWCSSEWAKAASALRPSWFMPLVASWPPYARDQKTRGVPPNYHELRSQFFQALIHNVKGFNMYAYFESRRFASLAIGPDQIGETLMLLRDHLLPDTLADGVRVNTAPAAPHFQAGLKIDGDKFCLIAVNTEMKTIQARFKLKKPVPELYVAGENREIALKDGVFNDVFAPGETHVYLIDRALAESVPNVAETLRRIEEYKRGRKKPGNLIGMGEMLVADYLAYSEGKVPPGVPMIEASSDPGNYFMTQRTGSRYYLIDGITNPDRAEMAWSPDSKDKTPFINITLPTAAKAKELRLYTPAANLKAGKVIASNGKEYTFADNKSKVITIPLDGSEIRSLRLEFTEFKVFPGSRDPGKRLLGEIELY